MKRRPYVKNRYVVRAHIDEAMFLLLLRSWVYGYNATQIAQHPAKFGRRKLARKPTRKTITNYYHHFGQRLFLAWVLRNVFDHPPIEFDFMDDPESIDEEIRGSCHLVVNTLSQIRRALYKQPNDSRELTMEALRSRQRFREVRKRSPRREKAKQEVSERFAMCREWNAWAEQDKPELVRHYATNPDIRQPNVQYLSELSAQMKGMPRKFFHTYMARVFYLDWHTDYNIFSRRTPQKNLYHLLKSSFKEHPLQLAFPLRLDVEFLMLIMRL